MAGAAATLELVLKARNETRKNFKTIQGSLKNLGKVALGLGGAAAAGVGALTVGIGKLAMDATKVTQVEGTFRSLLDTVGGDFPTAMEGLREASRGMVSDFELVQGANRFLSMGIADSQEEAADLTEIGTQLATALGKDASQGMEEFALMMANQSIPRLDTFGISAGAVRTRIKELMDANEDMTRETAFNTAVMEQAAVTMEKVGEQGDSSAADMARLQSTMANLKNDVGKAFLPTWNVLLGTVAEVAERAIPFLQQALKSIVPFIQGIAYGIESFVFSLMQGQGPIQAFVGAIEEAGFADFAAQVGVVAQKVQAFVAQLMTTIQPVIQWVQENVELKDILMGLGIAIAAVIIPALASLLAGIAPIILIFAAVTAAVVGIRKAWESNFLGIRDISQQVFMWLKTNVPPIIATVVGFIREKIAFVSGFIQENMGLIQSTIETVSNVIQTVWGVLWQVVQTYVKVAWEAIKAIVDVALTVITGVIKAAMQVIQGDWQGAWETIKQMVTDVWERLKTFIKDAVEIIRKAIGQAMGDVEMSWKDIWGRIRDFASEVWDRIKEIVGNALNNLKKQIQSVDLKAIGKSLIQGLIDGIKSMAGAAVNAAKEVVNNAVQGAKNLLGISSPSKVAAEMGESITTGIAVGLARGSDAVSEGMVNPLKTGMRGMSDVLLTVVDYVDRLARTMNKQAAETLEDVGDAVQEVAGGFRDLAEAASIMAGMGGGTGAEILTGWITEWKAHVDVLMDEILTLDMQRVDDMQEIAQDIRDVFNAVTVDLQMITDAELPDTGKMSAWAGAVQYIGNQLLDVIETLQATADQKELALETANELAGYVQGILQLLKVTFDIDVPDADFFEDFADYIEAVKTITENELIPWLKKLRDDWGVVILGTLASIASSVKRILSLLNVDLELTLPSETFAQDLDDYLDAVKSATDDVIAKLEKIKAKWELDALQTMGDIVDAVQGVLDLLGVDLSFDLPEMDNFAEQVGDYVDKVLTAVSTIISAMGVDAPEWAEETMSEFWEKVEEDLEQAIPIIEDIRGILDILSINLDFAVPETENFKAKVRNFVDAIFDAVGVIMDFMGFDAPEWAAEDIQQFWVEFEVDLEKALPIIEKIGKLLGDLTGGAELLSSLGDFIAPTEARIKNFVDNVKSLINKITAWVEQEWTEDSAELLKQTNAFAETTGKVFDALSAATSVIKDLGSESYEDLKEGLDNIDELWPEIKQAIKDVARGMKTVASDILTDWENGASEIAEKTNKASEMVSNTFGMLSTVIESLWDVAAVAGTGQLEESDWAGLAWAVTRFFAVISYALDQAVLAGEGIDAEGLQATTDKVERMSTAMRNATEALTAISDVSDLTASGLVGLLTALSGLSTSMNTELSNIDTALRLPPFQDVSWYTLGSNLMVSLINGLDSQMSNLRAKLATLRGLLPSSPAKEGPFSKPLDWTFLRSGLNDALGGVNAELRTPQLARAGGGRAPVTSGQPAGGRPIRVEIPVELNGREIARVVKDNLQDEFRRNGWRLDR